MERIGAHRRLHSARIRDCGLLLLCLLGWLLLYVGFRPAEQGSLVLYSSSVGSLIPAPAGQSAVKATAAAVTGEVRRRTDHVGTSSSLAYRQSFGFFHDVSDEDWTRRQERARTHRHQASDADKKVTEGLEANRWYMKNYFPLFTCPDQQRVGFGGDGPKWTCDPHRLAQPRAGGGGGEGPGAAHNSDKCLIYSIGSNGNYIFEEGLVKLLGAGTCEIHVFDMSQDYARDSDKEVGIYFHHWGLGSSYSKHGRKKGYTYLTLKETMEKLGHVNRTIDIFKIDCERCEWLSYKDWISDAVDIRQLLIETHGIPTDLGVNPADFFEDIERAGFAMFSKEPNIHPIVYGRCVEWGYVKLRKEFFGSRFAASSQS